MALSKLRDGPLTLSELRDAAFSADPGPEQTRAWAAFLQALFDDLVAHVGEVEAQRAWAEAERD